MEDLAGNFLLLPPGATLAGVDASTSDYLGVYSSVAPPSLCTGNASTTVPNTFDGLVGYIENNPQLTVTNVHDISIGGLTGTEMDIAMKPGKGDGCVDGVWVDLYVGLRPSSLVHSAVEGLDLRVALLHNGDATLAVEMDDVRKGGSDVKDWLTTAEATAQTFVFAPSGP